MIFIIIGGAVLLAVMLWTVILPFKPGALKIFGKIVCRRSEKMEITTSVAGYHQRGERSIEIYCNDYGRRRAVNGRTYAVAFVFAFALMLPFSAFIVILTDRLLFK